MVNNESKLCTGHLFDLFFLYIIDFDFFLIASGGVVGGKTCGFFKGCVRKLFSAGFYDDMRTRSALCMEPPVVADSKLKGQFLILQVVLTDIHGKTIAADIVERTACDFYLFGTAFSADIAAFDQLFLDLNKVFLSTCDVEGVRNGFQMLDFIMHLFGQGTQRLIGTFQFIIFFKIFLCIFSGSQLRIEGDCDRFAVVVIDRLEGFVTGLCTVTVGI
ncbi:Uncharacterised protein [uncultured Clostridium sp.]|nr:Uncharacterised protein [uncultured Clostridium sp.]